MDLTKRNSGLDLIRTTAILLVLIGHFELISNSFLNYTFYKMGVYGVELFFVLSGFLIGQILIKTFQKGINLSAIRTFWYRRWLRTLPLFLLVIIARELLLNPMGHFHYLHFLFLQMTIKPIGYDTMWFGESWSLAVEEWFYICIPFVFVIFQVMKLNSKKILFSMLGLLASFVVMRYLFLTQSPTPLDYNTGMRIFTPIRLDSILYGVLLAFIKVEFGYLYQQLTKFYVFLIALIVFVILNNWGNLLVYDYQHEKLIPATIGFSMVSVLFVLLIPYIETSVNVGNFVRKRGIHQIVTYTSLFSYCIYLIHEPIYQLVVAASNDFSTTWWLQLLIAIAIIYAIAYVCYFYFELPILKWRDRITAQNKKHD